jgi:hypothetical protein
MKRNASKGLVISKIFRILIVRLRDARQSVLAKGYRPLTEFILLQIFSTQEKNLNRRTHGWDISFYTDILL